MTHLSATPPRAGNPPDATRLQLCFPAFEGWFVRRLRLPGCPRCSAHVAPFNWGGVGGDPPRLNSAAAAAWAPADPSRPVCGRCDGGKKVAFCLHRVTEWMVVVTTTSVSNARRVHVGMSEAVVMVTRVSNRRQCRPCPWVRRG